MPVLGIDLGGTKLATAVFAEDGSILMEEKVSLAKREGAEVGKLIIGQVTKFLEIQKSAGGEIHSIGISVPGISYQASGTVWAPNIPGWQKYPLRDQVQYVAGNIPVSIDSDRACYILGESWKGVAKGCTDAIYLAVGTGIGAGILVNGSILRGSDDIAGAIGWMALERPFSENYKSCGCFEASASGEGISKLTKKVLLETKDYNGLLARKEIMAHDVFKAYEENDPVAQEVIRQSIELWGMAVANLISLFNPQKIIFGGGVFGPAIRFIPDIRTEAMKWAQPVSMKKVVIEASALGDQAGLYGAGLLALENLTT